jgi:hypothetical protein
MRLWMPLVVPPLIFLTLQSVNYALEPWACANQIVYPLHVSAALALLIAIAGAALSWREWQSVGGKLPDDKAEADSRIGFLAVLGLMVSALSIFAILALWATQLVVTPCVR